MISQRDVVGIGRIKMPKIPMLSFIVAKDETFGFCAICIHLRVEGYGRTARKAINDMESKIKYFLAQTFKHLTTDEAWESIRNLFHSEDDMVIELWDAYHDVQIELAKRGISTDSQIISKLLAEIVKLRSINKKLMRELLEKKLIEKPLVEYNPILDMAA
jgi:hypothetical protein